GEVCNNSVPQLNLKTYVGPWERLEQQRVAEFNRDVRHAKLMVEVGFTLATAGVGGAVVEGGVLAGEGLAATEGIPAAETAAEAEAVEEGSFSIIDWEGYPTEGLRPAGPFRLVPKGKEYNELRDL